MAYEIPFTGQTCHGNTIRLQCPSGFSISMVSVFYGRNDSSTCIVSQLDNNSNCSSTVAVNAVSSMCNGLQQCDIVASNASLGEDPCPSVSKLLKLNFLCKRK